MRNKCYFATGINTPSSKTRVRPHARVCIRVYVPTWGPKTYQTIVIRYRNEELLIPRCRYWLGRIWYIWSHNGALGVMRVLALYTREGILESYHQTQADWFSWEEDSIRHMHFQWGHHHSKCTSELVGMVRMYMRLHHRYQADTVILLFGILTDEPIQYPNKHPKRFAIPTTIAYLRPESSWVDLHLSFRNAWFDIDWHLSVYFLTTVFNIWIESHWWASVLLMLMCIWSVMQLHLGIEFGNSIPD